MGLKINLTPRFFLALYHHRFNYMESIQRDNQTSTKSCVLLDSISAPKIFVNVNK